MVSRLHFPTRRSSDLSIFEINRVARILLPVEMKSFSVAAPIVYESLPDRVFRAFRSKGREFLDAPTGADATKREIDLNEDRKSTRLNSSHLVISYSVF